MVAKWRRIRTGRYRLCVRRSKPWVKGPMCPVRKLAYKDLTACVQQKWGNIVTDLVSSKCVGFGGSFLNLEHLKGVGGLESYSVCGWFNEHHQISRKLG